MRKHNPSKLIFCVSVFCSLLFLSSCSSVRTTVIEHACVPINSIEASNVISVYYKHPSNSSLKLGDVYASGNSQSSFDDLISKAKKEAAHLGGDFIVCENSGVEKEFSYSPGYSSHSSNIYGSMELILVS